MDKTIEIKTREGKVVLEVQGYDEMMCLDPASAVQIGKAFIDAAVDLGANVQIQTPPRKINGLVRNQMIQRTTHIMRTMQTSKPVVVASHVVDSILAMLP